MRKIICTNDDNIAINFGDSFSPFLLVSCDGIYHVSNTINYSDNTMTDGSTYLGSTAKMRNIILTVVAKENHAVNRNLLYQLFKQKSPGQFIYHEEDGKYQEDRIIDYYVESIDMTTMGEIQSAEISLLCPYPFFQDLEDRTVTMAGWNKNFEFIHEFSDEGEEFGVRKIEKLKEIFNESGADYIGITINILAESIVKNPSIYHIEANEIIKIGTDSKPFIMQRDDKLIITTHTNNKNVYLVKNGVKTNVNEYLDEESSFIQLTHGKNNLRYAADEGEDFMIVDILFRYRYLGV